MPRRPDAPIDPATAIRAQGAAIQRARKAQGLTQPEAAAALGVELGTYRQWEQGRRRAPAAVRERVVREWGADGRELAAVEGKCPCCGRVY